MAWGETEANLLIISDLHLGEDIRPETVTADLRRLALLERELEAFLLHYSRVRLDGHPWRLIVNGDMVDFLSICLVPRSGETDAETFADTDPEDLVYGLGSRPRAARAKMRRVLERHPSVFRALARFLGAGNTVGVIAGNHDVEFHWPVVQETFRQGISTLWSQLPEAKAPGAPSAADLEAAIAFHHWFYFEQDVVWVEHGHQYDDYCSFDYVLEPVSPQREEIVMNVGAAGLRYVVNQSPGGGAQQEDWNLLGHVQWALRHGLGGAVRIGRHYLAMALRLFGVWRLFTGRPDAVEVRRRTHRERLREVAAQFKLGEETLLALDNLRRRPVITNLAHLLMALFIDRMLVGAVATLLVLTLVLALPWLWALGAVATVIGGAWLTARVLEKVRAPIDPIAKLRAMPDLIRRHVRARFVIFGHSHDPVSMDLGDGGKYFNTGTWVAAEKPGLLRAFTHVLVRKCRDGPQALLCQWRDGRSQVFVP